MGCIVSSRALPKSDPDPYEDVTLENTPEDALRLHLPPRVPARVLRVVDGDTLDLALYRQEYGRCYRYRVRLYGIDTPEKRPPLAQANREEEIAAAVRASAAMTAQLATTHHRVHLQLYGADKYGRLLGTIYQGPLDLCQWMIDQGHATPYFGKTKKTFQGATTNEPSTFDDRV